jgi:coenzyme F420-reducing hydrogenase beta subunit
MSRAGYRSSCYSCIYASPNKPADITLGDYTLTSIEAKKYQLLPTHTYSTILVHNDRGEKMLEDIKDNLILASANPNEVIARHGNLNHPSKITERGTLLYTAYLKGGYSRLQRIINFRMLKYEVYYYLTKSIKKIAISIKSKVKNV